MACKGLGNYNIVVKQIPCSPEFKFLAEDGLIVEYTVIVPVLRTEVIQNDCMYSMFISSTFLNYMQPISILGTALESPYVLCKELLFSQMNRISILWLQVSMTIKTKHSSAPTWYLMANAAAAFNSSIFIPTLSAEQRHYISPKQLNCFYSDFPLTRDLNTNN